MSNQESEKLRAIQEFANNYPVDSYFDNEESVFLFNKIELGQLLSKLWDKAWEESAKQTKEEVLLDSYERLREDVKFLLSKHAPD